MCGGVLRYTSSVTNMPVKCMCACVCVCLHARTRAHTAQSIVRNQIRTPGSQFSTSNMLLLEIELRSGLVTIPLSTEPSHALQTYPFEDMWH